MPCFCFALAEGSVLHRLSQDSLIRQGHAPTADIWRASILHLASRFDIEQRVQLEPGAFVLMFNPTSMH